MQRKKGRTRTEEEEGRDPQGAGFGRNSQGPESQTTSPACRRSLPQRRYLFSHVIHDAHEACQQFSFLSSGKFLLGLLLAAFLHPGGCHPPSARFTPGAHRVGQEVARSWHAGASVYHTLRPGLRLPRRAPGQAAGGSAAPAVGQGPAAPSEAPGEATSRARLRLPQKQSPEVEPAHFAQGGGGTMKAGVGRGLHAAAARRTETQGEGAALGFGVAHSSLAREGFGVQLVRVCAALCPREILKFRLHGEVIFFGKLGDRTH